MNCYFCGREFDPEDLTQVTIRGSRRSMPFGFRSRYENTVLACEDCIERRKKGGGCLGMLMLLVVIVLVISAIESCYGPVT